MVIYLGSVRPIRLSQMGRDYNSFFLLSDLPIIFVIYGNLKHDHEQKNTCGGRYCRKQISLEAALLPVGLRLWSLDADGL